MITLKEAVVVEGKYDKIKLASFLNAVIIPTNGFAIYKDKEKLELIKYYAKKTGIIILTDSDSAGFKIRSYLKGSIKKEYIKNVYIPDILGKEKRKVQPSAEGKLGVEGINKNILLEAFKKAGITSVTDEKRELITKTDLYFLGLSGNPDSAEKRKILKKSLNIPELLSTSSMLDILNTMMSLDELKEKLINLGIYNNEETEK